MTTTTTPTTPTTPPASPSSHTRALWPADPAPQHWPAPRFDARGLLAARLRRAEDDATVRRMVDELVAMGEVST